MEGTVERIEATTTKNGKPKWRVWIAGEEHTDWDRPNYEEGTTISYTLQEKPKDTGGTWKTIRGARRTEGSPQQASAAPAPSAATSKAFLLEAAVAMTVGKAKFTDVYQNYLALKDMVESKEEEPEPEEQAEEGSPV